VTDRIRRAVIFGLMLGAFGCSRSLISCSSSLMNCSSALPDGEEEDRLHAERRASRALIDARGNAVATPGAPEDRRARERPAPVAASPDRASTAFSISRPNAVDVAVRRGETTESVHRALVRTALTYLGAPYRWGGLTPAGFDCSGFVKYVHARMGISIPHNVAAQYRYGTPVSRDQLEPGDLVFFDHLRHNGIYIGRGLFIHATKTGDSVRISNLDDRWYKSRWVGGRRLAPEALPPAGRLAAHDES
jgi:cell wall-associated NlpC family hydrolase